MKLYSIPHSPYAARVRIQIALRELPVDVCPPPGGLGSDEYRNLGALGKVPSLDLGDKVIPESAAIMEYLEDRFSDNPLRSEGLEQRAWQRALIRYCDLYFAQALFPLFAALQTGGSDKEKMQQGLASLKDEFANLERMLKDAGKQPGASIDFADAALAPAVHYAIIVPAIFGEQNIMAATPLVAEWWQGVSGNTAVAAELAEIDSGLKAMLGK